jgi:GNAT superfamily N-acetyltransferase
VVEIRALNKASQNDFLEFMAAKAFETNPQWAGCYCQFYLDTEADLAGAKPTAERNRQAACDRIENGSMHGYLAYEAEQVVGWVAANKANNFVALPATGEDVARVLCFIVDAEHQGKGIATRLLNFAISDLGAQGFKSIEAAPVASDTFEATGYRGKLSTFLKAGFEQGPMVDDHHVLVVRQLTD